MSYDEEDEEEEEDEEDEDEYEDITEKNLKYTPLNPISTGKSLILRFLGATGALLLVVFLLNLKDFLPY